MPADTPYLAAREHLRDAQRVVSCISNRVARLAEDDGEYLVASANPMVVRGLGRTLGVMVREWIGVVPEPGRRRSWLAHLNGYTYELNEADGTELLLYHWHPSGLGHMGDPHLHLGPALRQAMGARRSIHLPTGHVQLHDFVGMLIREMAVEPLRRDWERVLAAARV